MKSIIRTISNQYLISRAVSRPKLFFRPRKGVVFTAGLEWLFYSRDFADLFLALGTCTYQIHEPV